MSDIDKLNSEITLQQSYINDQKTALNNYTAYIDAVFNNNVLPLILNAAIPGGAHGINIGKMSAQDQIALLHGKKDDLASSLLHKNNSKTDTDLASSLAAGINSNANVIIYNTMIASNPPNQGVTYNNKDYVPIYVDFYSKNSPPYSFVNSDYVGIKLDISWINNGQQGYTFPTNIYIVNPDGTHTTTGCTLQNCIAALDALEAQLTVLQNSYQDALSSAGKIATIQKQTEETKVASTQVDSNNLSLVGKVGICLVAVFLLYWFFIKK